MKKILYSMFTIGIFLFFSSCGDTEKETMESINKTKILKQTIENNQVKIVKEVKEEDQSITLNELKTIKFIGVEPNWTLVFKDNYIDYTQGYDTRIIKMVYYGDYDGSNNKIKVISNNEIQVKLIEESALDKGYIWTATIKKENCSDGMSDSKYPYSIKVQLEEGFITACGITINSNTEDFTIFWKKFQNIIANNNKVELLKISSKSMKDFLQATPNFIDARMKKEVAKTNASSIENRENEQKLFIYKIITGPENEYTANYSTFGFWFKKINGKWIVDQPQMGG